MHQIRTEIKIDRPASEVWQVFQDIARYGEWNPFIVEIAGELEIDRKLRVRLQQPGGKPMVFRPRITELERGKRLAWLGHLFVPRVFDGEHYFELEELEDGQCRFVQGERFTGVLVPFLTSMIDGQTRSGFEAMNQALKKRVENLNVSSPDAKKQV